MATGSGIDLHIGMLHLGDSFLASHMVSFPQLALDVSLKPEVVIIQAV